MEYQKIITLLDNAANQPSKFKKNIVFKQMMTHVERVKPMVKFKFKTSMLQSISCDYSDAYILLLKKLCQFNHYHHRKQTQIIMIKK